MSSKRSFTKDKTPDFLKKTVRRAKNILSSIHPSKEEQPVRVLSRPCFKFDVHVEDFNFIIHPTLINLCKELSATLYNRSGNLSGGYVSVLTNLSIQDPPIKNYPDSIDKSEKFNSQGISHRFAQPGVQSTPVHLTPQLTKINTFIVGQPFDRSTPAVEETASPSDTTSLVLYDQTFNPENSNAQSGMDKNSCIIIKTYHTEEFNDPKLEHLIAEKTKRGANTRPQIEPYRVNTIDTNTTLLRQSEKQVHTSSNRSSHTKYSSHNRVKRGKSYKKRLFFQHPTAKPQNDPVGKHSIGSEQKSTGDTNDSGRPQSELAEIVHNLTSVKPKEHKSTHTKTNAFKKEKVTEKVHNQTSTVKEHNEDMYNRTIAFKDEVEKEPYSAEEDMQQAHNIEDRPDICKNQMAHTTLEPEEVNVTFEVIDNPCATSTMETILLEEDIETVRANRYKEKLHKARTRSKIFEKNPSMPMANSNRTETLRQSNHRSRPAKHRKLRRLGELSVHCSMKSQPSDRKERTSRTGKTNIVEHVDNDGRKSETNKE